MLVLAGFAVSNYYNKVKLAMLEKGVAFTEELNWASKDEPTLEASPLGKVPFLRTPQGTLCESQVILEYLEDAYPQVPLLPVDPFERAKVRELVAFTELHLELVARRVYAQAFFGGTVSQGTIDATRRDLERGVAAFARLARFAPFLAGDRFTMADCVAVVHLPVISMAGKAIWGEDPLAALPVRDYVKRLGERPTVQKVNADRKANTELLAKTRAK
ncbi:MAG: glutathione S-transferase [Lautropia sp.]|nr:MAG: glutathione S-transferase [Pseudomonadota bacterium]MBC6958444.1 glutathione S-transferase [Lautropia sp.]MCL4700416.1 glutathione S-transferase N-terminal domain-containing protein [Burkholderiaceae bacterium]MCZ2415684.1 glutathione S-transferase [Burkholderiales bacterium]MDL1906960.1 glutathione S-transferase [Betaproteobacteria bacterium PRO1]